jgi:hypothetical protein
MWLFRRFASLLAERQIIIYGFTKSLLDPMHGVRLKRDNIADANDFSVEDLCIIVKYDLTGISLVLHHGKTPASIRNRRIDLTAPLSVSFLG